TNPYRIEYEQEVSWPYTNGQYVSELRLSEENGSYILDSKLVDSSDRSFSPRWADGYVRAHQEGANVFVVGCNYMVPRSGSFQGKFNDMARERLALVGENLLNWVKRVSQDNQAAEKYRKRLQGLLHRLR
ncbi:MAG: hypothetical protein HY075_10400, partial [Deltaproteobacteria bacterium]|nr:hypothetical protein [Deltaproteobacteria bacterium]